jgi:hypothetical protein
MIGPGKYDDACSAAWTATEAEGVLLIVINGNQGSGFSARASVRVLRDVPKILHSIADQLAADAAKIDST